MGQEEGERRHNKAEAADKEGERDAHQVRGQRGHTGHRYEPAVGTEVKGAMAREVVERYIKLAGIASRVI